jgi:hypothetical protein
MIMMGPSYIANVHADSMDEGYTTTSGLPWMVPDVIAIWEKSTDHNIIFISASEPSFSQCK